MSRLYHGSISRIEKVDLSFANPLRDFGAGFYTTTSRHQALRFSKTIAQRNKGSFGILNEYDYHADDNLQVWHLEAKNIAIQILRTEKLHDQWVFKTSKSLSALQYLNSERIDV